MNEREMTTQAEPWQLKMFRRSLKKQLKLRALLQMLGPPDGGASCLLLTCGDNNGALNHYFGVHSGQWTWGDVAGENLVEMSAFLGKTVHETPEDGFPFAAESFDCVVAIDVLEHLEDDGPFLAEVWRVLRPGGRALITAPNGDPRLLANRIRWRLGMTPEVYGHTRAGYNIPELSAAVQRARLRPIAHGGYSRFFTEMVELIINFGYVFMLSRKKGGAREGHIAPTTSGELKQHGLAYRLYGLAFPLMRLISGLDHLLPGVVAGEGAVTGVGAVIVLALKGMEAGGKEVR